MPKESQLIRNLKTKINKLPNTRIKKLWSNANNRDVDILIVTHGIACFFEIKVPGEEPTSWQYNQLGWWAASGAVTGWYDDVDACVADVQRVFINFNWQANIKLAAHWSQLAIEADNKKK